MPAPNKKTSKAKAKPKAKVTVKDLKTKKDPKAGNIHWKIQPVRVRGG